PGYADQLRSLRVACYVEDGVAPVTSETAQTVHWAADVLRDSGFEVREERPPGISEGSRLWIELFAEAAQQQLREFYRGREDEAGPIVLPMLQEENGSASCEGKVNTAERRARAVSERERLL